jgi:hypothetical protein
MGIENNTILFTYNKFSLKKKQNALLQNSMTNKVSPKKRPSKINEWNGDKTHNALKLPRNTSNKSLSYIYVGTWDHNLCFLLHPILLICV